MAHSAKITKIMVTGKKYYQGCKPNQSNSKQNRVKNKLDKIQ